MIHKEDILASTSSRSSPRYSSIIINLISIIISIPQVISQTYSQTCIEPELCLRPLSYNNASGLPTSNAPYTSVTKFQRHNHFFAPPFNLTSGTTLYPFYNHNMDTLFRLTLYTRDGTVYASIASDPVFNTYFEKTGAINLGSNKFVLMTSANGAAVYTSITSIGATGAISLYRVMSSSPSFISLGLISDFKPLTTFYGYTGITESGGSPSSRLAKIDFSNTGTYYSSNFVMSSTPYTGVVYSLAFLFVNSDLILNSPISGTSINFINKLTMEPDYTMSSFTITNHGTGSMAIIYSGLVNNLLETELFLVHRYWTGTDYIAISLGARLLSIR
jgi:hypothetical protein